jgi:hypothetical protein
MFVPLSNFAATSGAVAALSRFTHYYPNTQFVIWGRKTWRARNGDFLKTNHFTCANKGGEAFGQASLQALQTGLVRAGFS